MTVETEAAHPYCRAVPTSPSRVSNFRQGGYTDVAAALQRNLTRLLFCAQVADHWHGTLDPSSHKALSGLLRAASRRLRAEGDRVATELRAVDSVPDARPSTLAALEQVHYVPTGCRPAEEIAETAQIFLATMSHWTRLDRLEVARLGHANAARFLDEVAATFAEIEATF